MPEHLFPHTISRNRAIVSYLKVDTEVVVNSTAYIDLSPQQLSLVPIPPIFVRSLRHLSKTFVCLFHSYCGFLFHRTVCCIHFIRNAPMFSIFFIVDCTYHVYLTSLPFTLRVQANLSFFLHLLVVCRRVLCACILLSSLINGLSAYCSFRFYLFVSCLSTPSR